MVLLKILLKKLYKLKNPNLKFRLRFSEPIKQTQKSIFIETNIYFFLTPFNHLRDKVKFGFKKLYIFLNLNKKC